MSRHPQQPVAYQIRIVLIGVSPLIWRCLLVPSDISLARLHSFLQILFSWGGEHMHRFRIHGKDYGIAYLGGTGFDDDPHQVRLSDFHIHRRERFLYEYDFTARWELEIRLENILPLDLKRPYPICIGGRRAGPPEHCAGTLAYLEQLDQYASQPPIEDLSLLADAVGRYLESGDRKLIGDFDDLREALERIEAYRQFQPDHFDRRRVNRQLRALAG
jgi:Plasmid pRiA4b ORF-3-like protein